jgi:hypothetical protein
VNDATIARLLDHVSTLARAGGDYNRLTVSAGAYHVLITGARDRESVTVELVGNRDLPRAERLTEGRAAVIESHGYRRSSRKPGPYRAVPLERADAHAALGVELADIFTRAYGLGPDDKVDFAVSLGDLDRTRNTELISAMRLVAQKRDNDARTQLYRELAKATYLLPITRAAPDRTDEDDEPHVFEMMGDHPVLGVFTDWTSLRLWRPRGCPYVHKAAHELFPMVSQRRAATLLINHRGTVGGQLYRHEIEMIDAAIKRLRRR